MPDYDGYQDVPNVRAYQDVDPIEFLREKLAHSRDPITEEDKDWLLKIHISWDE